LIIICTVEPELVSVAVPVSVPEEFKSHYAEAVSVAVLAVAVKVIVPGNVVTPVPLVSVRVYLIV
jgi:hypothetical protein